MKVRSYFCFLGTSFERRLAGARSGANNNRGPLVAVASSSLLLLLLLLLLAHFQRSLLTWRTPLSMLTLVFALISTRVQLTDASQQLAEEPLAPLFLSSSSSSSLAAVAASCWKRKSNNVARSIELLVFAGRCTTCARKLSLLTQRVSCFSRVRY